MINFDGQNDGPFGTYGGFPWILNPILGRFGCDGIYRMPKPVARSKPKREALEWLYREGFTFSDIAERIGGTPQGVRSTIRKMIERGELQRRKQPRRRKSGR